jgi:galacturan 1,4-alpha-galacturonidase
MDFTIFNAKNLVFKQLRFVQSQMWTMAVMHSSNVLLEAIYISSTSSTSSRAPTTDGADTLQVDNITFRHWTIANGDDGISYKANTTNVLIESSTFHGGAVAIDSIRQYLGEIETMENVTIQDIQYLGPHYPAYARTWTGKQKGITPNGGEGVKCCKFWACLLFSSNGC